MATTGKTFPCCIRSLRRIGSRILLVRPCHFFQALKAEAERRRLAKENAEKKRIVAIQREKEKMQELISKKQQEQELNKMANDTRTEADRHVDFIQENAHEEAEMPAIVHNRIKLFKETEKANKEKQEVIYL